jgi:hypothetical protein
MEVSDGGIPCTPRSFAIKATTDPALIPQGSAEPPAWPREPASATPADRKEKDAAPPAHVLRSGADERLLEARRSADQEPHHAEPTALRRPK